MKISLSFAASVVFALVLSAFAVVASGCKCSTAPRIVSPDCDDGIPCTDDVYSQTTGECVNSVNDALCSNGRTCDLVVGCIADIRSSGDDFECALDPNRSPGHLEVGGDGIDNDCDGLTDAHDPSCVDCSARHE